MGNNLHESLSALMDNEAGELEVRRILKEMDAAADSDSQALKARWYRYHVVSASLKQEIHSAPSRNLLAGIRKELANEAVPESQGMKPVRPHSNFVRLIGQGAIAASVAMAVLFTADLALNADNPDSSGNAELADNTLDENQQPTFTGQLNPSMKTRVAVQEGLDQAEMDRLRQVVSQEMEETLESTPATFSPEENL